MAKRQFIPEIMSITSIHLVTYVNDKSFFLSQCWDTESKIVEENFGVTSD